MNKQINCKTCEKNLVALKVSSNEDKWRLKCCTDSALCTSGLLTFDLCQSLQVALHLFFAYPNEKKDL